MPSKFYLSVIVLVFKVLYPFYRLFLFFKSSYGRWNRLFVNFMYNSWLNLDVYDYLVHDNSSSKRKGRIFCKRLCLVLVLFFFGGGVLLNWNPFDISKKSDELSQEIISKIITPFFSETKHREKIVLLTVNDKAIDYVSEAKISNKLISSNSWPIKYEDHANILRAISLVSKPKQVFIDFEFKRIRNTDHSFPVLMSEVNRLKQNGIHVMHAIGSPNEMIAENVNQKFLQSGSVPVFNGNPTDYDYYMPLFQNDKKGQEQLAPALKMFENIKGQDISLNNYSESMFIQWPVVCDEDATDRSSLTDKLDNILSQNMFSEFKNYPIACIPAQVISINTLQSYWSEYKAKYSGRDPASLKESIRVSDIAKNKMIEAFEGATVIYAADYIALSDVVYAPNYGFISGAFVHIAALDNLLNFETDYFKKIDERYVNGFLLVLALVVSVLFVWLEMFRHGFILNLMLIVFIIFLSIGIVSALTGITKIAPVNMISLLYIFTLYLMTRKVFCYVQTAQLTNKERIS